jgi:hypothetical protein
VCVLCSSIYSGKKKKVSEAPKCEVGVKMGCGVDFRGGGKRRVYFTHNSQTVSLLHSSSLYRYCSLINIHEHAYSFYIVNTNSRTSPVEIAAISKVIHLIYFIGRHLPFISVCRVMSLARKTDECIVKTVVTVLTIIYVCLVGVVEVFDE